MFVNDKLKQLLEDYYALEAQTPKNSGAAGYERKNAAAQRAYNKYAAEAINQGHNALTTAQNYFIEKRKKSS